MTIRILVADDQALVRTGMVMVLSAEPDLEIVGEAADGAEAVKLTQQLAPDVVVMDVRMPGDDGLAATRLLQADSASGDGPGAVPGETAGPRVLVVTTFPDDDVVIDALRAGAAGFVLKHAVPAELVDAVRTVAAGGAWIDKRVAATVVSAVTQAPGSGTAAGTALAELTAREREILTLMAYGLTNADIKDRLTLSEATVKTHVARILSKTGVHDRGQAIALAYRSGLVTAGPS